MHWFFFPLSSFDIDDEWPSSCALFFCVYLSARGYVGSRALRGLRGGSWKKRREGALECVWALALDSFERASKRARGAEVTLRGAAERRRRRARVFFLPFARLLSLSLHNSLLLLRLKVRFFPPLRVSFFSLSPRRAPSSSHLPASISGWRAKRKGERRKRQFSRFAIGKRGGGGRSLRAKTPWKRLAPALAWHRLSLARLTLQSGLVTLLDAIRAAARRMKSSSARRESVNLHRVRALIDRPPQPSSSINQLLSRASPCLLQPFLHSQFPLSDTVD